MTGKSFHARLTMIAGPRPGECIEPARDEFVIGRLSPADLVINHPEISKKHALLKCLGDTWSLNDLGSTNGTYVNGKPVLGSQVLADGDEILLGNEVKLAFSLVPIGADAGPVARRVDKISPSREEFAETILDGDIVKEDIRGSLPPALPRLLVTIAGQNPSAYTLTKDHITMGRAEGNDIVVASQIVSRRHAVLEKTPSGYEIVIAPGATNTLTCQGRPVIDRQRLEHGDMLRIDSEIPGMMVTMAYLSPSQAASRISAVQFGEKERLTFGRDENNDIVLENPNISRFHAQVTRVGRRYYVSDLRSANGTFVNDKRVEGNVWLNPSDTVRLGSYKFILGTDEFTLHDETAGLRVEASHLCKWVRKNLNLLQDISLVFQPREFIVIVGQSGGGKSTLLDAIAGYRPATLGQVLVNGTDVYRNFDAVRNEIGYVPQKDIIHMELTVYQALDFAAQLRMPKDTSKAERHQRILDVLNELDLAHRKDVQISGLSGGQQKRVSIGVELLTRPGLFFLDEPTSGLDPGTETAFMHLMRRLADQGRDIIMVTHATKNVMLADKVVFLARGGYLAWFGPPDEALTYFDQYRSDQDRRIHPMEFDQIYAILDDPAKGQGKDWGDRFRASLAFQKYIAQPLKFDQTAPKEPAQPLKKAARKGGRISSLRQFLVLSARNVTILTRDRSSLILMLAVPLGVGALSFILAMAMGKDPFNYVGGDPANGSTSLFLLSLYALLVGGMSQMREFVKEAGIYRRERLVNLKIFPYVTSKIWIALLLALWHALAYTGMQYLAYKMPGGLLEFGMIYVTLVLAVITGMMLGLLASAIAPTAASAPMTLIMLIVPLIVLSGALAPIPTRISQFASTRWAYQSLLGISGQGADVAADPCWHLSGKMRGAMTLDDKSFFQCKCMGVNVFKRNSCNFPSAGTYYVETIDLPAPAEPASLPAQPAEPVIPAAPAPPEDNYNQVQIAQYLNSLTAYQATVKAIQDDYRRQMDIYKMKADVYTNQMAKYQEDLATYYVSRISAVKSVEGIIEAMKKKYFDWAYVDKNNPDIFYPWLLRTWFAQVEIVFVYFVIILFLIKRKDIK